MPTEHLYQCMFCFHVFSIFQTDEEYYESCIAAVRWKSLQNVNNKKRLRTSLFWTCWETIQQAWVKVEAEWLLLTELYLAASVSGPCLTVMSCWLTGMLDWSIIIVMLSVTYLLLPPWQTKISLLFLNHRSWLFFFLPLMSFNLSYSIKFAKLKGSPCFQRNLVTNIVAIDKSQIFELWMADAPCVQWRWVL